MDELVSPSFSWFTKESSNPWFRPNPSYFLYDFSITNAWFGGYICIFSFDQVIHVGIYCTIGHGVDHVDLALITYKFILNIF